MFHVVCYLYSHPTYKKTNYFIAGNRENNECLFLSFKNSIINRAHMVKYFSILPDYKFSGDRLH